MHQPLAHSVKAMMLMKGSAHPEARKLWMVPGGADAGAVGGFVL